MTRSAKAARHEMYMSELFNELKDGAESDMDAHYGFFASPKDDKVYHILLGQESSLPSLEILHGDIHRMVCASPEEWLFIVEQNPFITLSESS